jgi:hypothetical protein
MFSYNPVHQVIVCSNCHSCILPGRASQTRHLRAKPHRLRGDALKATLQLFSSYSVRTVDELRAYKPRAEDGVTRIKGLAPYPGFHCLQSGCVHHTRSLQTATKHAAVHKKELATAIRPPDADAAASCSWDTCTLQTYFTAKGQIDYFVVFEQEDEKEGSGHPGPIQARGPQRAYLKEKEGDFERVKDDIAEQAGIVQGFGDSRSAQVPWLQKTAFPSQLEGLTDDEIKGSFKLPSRKAEDDGGDRALCRILDAAEALFHSAYQLCSDASPNRKMTQQRANILNGFYTGASGRSEGFRYHKNASTLAKYFRAWKQLLTYYYRVVHGEDGHFSKASPKQRVPKDAIEHTQQQQQAMAGVARALEDAQEQQQGEQGDEEALKRAVRPLCLALICQTVGSVPFTSPVLSFCAMLSRTKAGQWQEPGNFNSHLSALTWTAQLILFENACFCKQDDEDGIPAYLSQICQQYFQQLAETPFGYILQWRLYLFGVSRRELSKHQARWSLDGQRVEYRGLELQMCHVPQLVISEFQQAHDLLYSELLFQAQDLTPMQSWKPKDDLDRQGFGESWLTNPANAELLDGATLALFRRIQQATALRAMFFTQGPDGRFTLDRKAIDIYEAQAQEFLKRLLVLTHITAGQALREPELLSVTWCDTSRQRHIYLWEKLVMLYTQYHKGQLQTGVYKDNIRFLPKPIGDLLLDYLAYVLPLRQMFLRHRTPGALMSPYLWSRLDGSVFPDGTLSTCLSKACARAMVPQLQMSNWRQISASICKEKFSVKEQANFDLRSGQELGDIDEEELDLVALAEHGNHSYPTFNRAYAGSTTLTMNALLHRGHRASAIWQGLFQFESVLRPKRAWPASSGTLPLRMSDAYKRGQVRQRPAYPQSALLAIARKLYNQPDLQWRTTGQRHGLLAVMGPQPAEQVVVVLGTGSGKSLIFMVGAAAADARTTILILPAVALRADMLWQCLLAGIRPLV